MDTLDGVIVALCHDYERRQLAIEEGKLGRRVLMEYAYVNQRMREAAALVVGERWCEVYIKEIGDKVGYAKTKLWLNERSYKMNKSKIKRAIAKSLYLLD